MAGWLDGCLAGRLTEHKIVGVFGVHVVVGCECASERERKKENNQANT